MSRREPTNRCGRYRCLWPLLAAPLVVFLHGWTVVSPQLYGAWIEHIVRKGSIDALTQVPASNRNFVTISSDYYGRPPLIADHSAPTAVDLGLPPSTLNNLFNSVVFMVTHWGVVDAMDYYGYWKLFDGLCDAAFHGRNREYALGDTPQQRFMGTWSDGVPVRPLEVMRAPG